MISTFDFDRRSSGLLIHPTSLPGPFGQGDIGPAAHAFVDFLAEARQTWWQMLPVTPPGPAPGNSPYSSFSAFAGSPLLISPEKLVENGWLHAADLPTSAAARASTSNSDFALAARLRWPLLERAFDRFRSRGNRSQRAALEEFCERERFWLDDYALFSALKIKFDQASWWDWPKRLRLRDPAALREAFDSLAQQVELQRFAQFLFDRQWLDLRAHATSRGVGLIGDIPIFVAHDSSDVWAQRRLFCLDASGRARTQSGYPPDMFNAQGQTWGHPHYDWDAHRAEGYAWWIARFAATFRWFDASRIDHFLGFHRTWHVPGKAKNAKRGKWVLAPGGELFEAVVGAIGHKPIIAEDLGQLTVEAALLRDKFRFPGMRVVQFGFGAGGSYHLPHVYPHRCVAYTGTHDNSTIVGYLDRIRKFSTNGRSTPAGKAEFEKVMSYLRSDGREFHWDMIRTLAGSVANTTIFPVQDLLGLDDKSRMNIPGEAEGNWTWRLKPAQLTSAHARTLRETCELFDRAAARAVSPVSKPAAARRAATRRRSDVARRIGAPA